MTESIPITEQSSKALAAKIICYRVLKLHKEAAKEAMIELEKRKSNGDDFDFISYIDGKIKDMPESSVGTEQLDNLKKTLRNIKNGSI